MKGRVQKVALGFGAFLALAACLALAFIALAAGSDFSNRGCDMIPLEEWAFTANCEDADAVWNIAVAGAALSGGVAGACLWRLRHA
jgi:hypothetical protein